MGAAKSEEWFRPGTYSVWAYDREGEGTPVFLVLYEWEIASLRGVQLCGAMGSLLDVESPKEEWDTDYKTLRDEVMDPSDMASLQLAQLIYNGNLHRIGPMPRLEGYREPPAGCGTQPREAATAPPQGD
jgi:hypothetical protein